MVNRLRPSKIEGVRPNFSDDCKFFIQKKKNLQSRTNYYVEIHDVFHILLLEQDITM